MKAQIAKSILLAKFRSDETKLKYIMKQEKAKKEKTNFLPPKQVEMSSIEYISSDGKVLIKFNQPLDIPEFVKNA